MRLKISNTRTKRQATLNKLVKLRMIAIDSLPTQAIEKTALKPAPGVMLVDEATSQAVKVKQLAVS